MAAVVGEQVLGAHVLSMEEDELAVSHDGVPELHDEREVVRFPSGCEVNCGRPAEGESCRRPSVRLFLG